MKRIILIVAFLTMPGLLTSASGAPKKNVQAILELKVDTLDYILENHDQDTLCKENGAIDTLLLDVDQVENKEAIEKLNKAKEKIEMLYKHCQDKTEDQENNLNKALDFESEAVMEAVIEENEENASLCDDCQVDYDDEETKAFMDDLNSMSNDKSSKKLITAGAIVIICIVTPVVGVPAMFLIYLFCCMKKPKPNTQNLFQTA